VLLIGCGDPATPAPVSIYLDLGESAVLLVETANIANQDALRRVREVQRVCFTGTLSRKASATELAKFDAVRFDGVQASHALEPFAIDAVTTCGAGVKMPTALKQQPPKYTLAALRAGVQVTVFLAALIDADGKVADVRVLRSLNRQLGLDHEAVVAAKQWRFAPATKDGQPVPMTVSVEMTFALRDRK